MEIFVPSEASAFLRSNHAGEAGAVAVYSALLRFRRWPDTVDFARRHIEAERKHLEGFRALLPERGPSVLLPLWRLGGFIAAVFLTVLGRRAVFAGIAAIEDGVVRYFRSQLDRFAVIPGTEDLRKLLEEYTADETRHREEASFLCGPRSPGLKVLGESIRVGGVLAAAVTRRL